MPNRRFANFRVNLASRELSPTTVKSDLAGMLRYHGFSEIRSILNTRLEKLYCVYSGRFSIYSIGTKLLSAVPLPEKFSRILFSAASSLMIPVLSVGRLEEIRSANSVLRYSEIMALSAAANRWARLS
ncbi:hypothetical protein D3C74_374420 [compost metagenome]